MAPHPTHHPSAPLLTAAASGVLSPAVSRIVNAHAALCDHCRARMNRLETIGGVELDNEEPVELASAALETAFAAIAKAGTAPALPASLAALPPQVHDLVASALGKAVWYSGGPGLKIVDLDLPRTAAGETFQLFRIEPGSGPPKHTHGGQEFTLVLTGAFKDETGVYRQGDLEIGDEAVTHRPVAELGEICYALAVTTGPLKFKGPLGLLQRVLNFGRQ